MTRFRPISFPQREWDDIKQRLNNNQVCSTIRCCEEFGKYKKDKLCLTPWKDLIKIQNITKYNKVEDIPTWHQLDKGMKISVKKASLYDSNRWEYIKYNKN